MMEAHHRSYSTVNESPSTANGQMHLHNDHQYQCEEVPHQQYQQHYSTDESSSVSVITTDPRSDQTLALNYYVNPASYEPLVMNHPMSSNSSSASSVSSIMSDGGVSTDSAPEAENRIESQIPQVVPLMPAKQTSSGGTGSGSASANMRSLLKQQHRQTNEITLQWLEQNYVLRPNICLPRCLIYHRYLEFIQKIRPGSKPIGAAAFGKLVRQKFPKISTRRLGTRGQSKYHYYGIGVRQSSPFFEDQTTIMITQNQGGSPPSAILQDLRYHQRNQGSLPPPPPPVTAVAQPPQVSTEMQQIIPVTNAHGQYQHHQSPYQSYPIMDVYCHAQNFYVDPGLAQFSSQQQSSIHHHQQQQQQQFPVHPSVSDLDPQTSLVSMQEIGHHHHHAFAGFPQHGSVTYDGDGVVQVQVPLTPEINMFHHNSLVNDSVSSPFSLKQSTKSRHVRQHDNKRRNRMLMQTIPGARCVTGRSTPFTEDEPMIPDDQRRLMEQVSHEFETFCSLAPNATFGYFQQNYPAPEDLPKPPSEISRQILATFLVMYHSHCQRIFDTFQLANVDELRRSLLNFWQEMPGHLAPLMASPFVIQVIHLVDILLYRTIEDFFSQLSLMPEMSETFVSDMKMILINVNEWLGGAILGQSSRMRAIITQYQLTNQSKISDEETSSKQTDNVYNQVEQHLMKLLRLKSETFDEFSMAIQKQLKFIDIVKECRKRIQHSRQMFQMQAEIQSLTTFLVDTNGNSIGTDQENVPGPNEMLTVNVSELVNSGEKSNSNVNKTKEELLDTVTQTGAVSADIDHACQCPVPEIILQQIYEQFQLLIRYMQYVEINLVKILAWTKSCVDRNVMKCNSKCLKRRSKILLYGINFYVSNVMRDLTVNDCKSLAIWNMVFVCIKEYVLLHLTRVDRYEAKLAHIRNGKTTIIKIESIEQEQTKQQSRTNEFWYCQTATSSSSSSSIHQPAEHYETKIEPSSTPCYQSPPPPPPTETEEQQPPSTIPDIQSTQLNVSTNSYVTGNTTTTAANGNVYTCLS